jgi:hypothetical protein
MLLELIISLFSGEIAITTKDFAVATIAMSALFIFERDRFSGFGGTVMWYSVIAVALSACLYVVGSLWDIGIIVPSENSILREADFIFAFAIFLFALNIIGGMFGLFLQRSRRW